MKRMLIALAGIALIGIAIACRHWLERSMALHMLAQIPMLLIAGACIACSLPQGFLKRLRAYDENGVTGLTIFLLVTGYWMIPKALDSVLVSNAMESGKFVSLFFAGLLLPGSLSRANTVIQLFFIGNFGWMMAIVGLLYQDTPQRLCNFYLIDDQVVAGTGLVALAIALPLAWVIRRFTGMDRQSSLPADTSTPSASA